MLTYQKQVHQEWLEGCILNARKVQEGEGTKRAIGNLENLARWLGRVYSGNGDVEIIGTSVEKLVKGYASPSYIALQCQRIVEASERLLGELGNVRLCTD